MTTRFSIRFSSSHRLLATLAAVAWAGLASAQGPQGSEFQVNQFTMGFQTLPEIASAADGSFAVVWGSEFADNGDDETYSLQTLRFDSNGAPVAQQFLVNTYTTGQQFRSDIAMASNGDVVIVWESFDGDPDSDFGIWARRFGSSGQPAGEPFLVNQYTTNLQIRPAVAMDGEGRFVVVWSSYNSVFDGFGYGISGRRFASDGLPIGGDFGINTYTTRQQEHPSISMAADGRFVVAWQSSDADNGDDAYTSIQGQRFASDATPIGGQFLVNSLTSSFQRYPSVGTDIAGGFVVTWQGAADQSVTSIQARRFSSDGAPLGEEFLVNSVTPSLQYEPKIARGTAGEWLVTWHSRVPDTNPSTNTAQGQLLAPDGRFIGGQFQLETLTEGNQQNTDIAATPNGFLVTWVSAVSAGGDTADSSIQARPVLSALIFTDGFESGDSSAWNAVEPTAPKGVDQPRRFR